MGGRRLHEGPRGRPSLPAEAFRSLEITARNNFCDTTGGSAIGQTCFIIAPNTTAPDPTNVHLLHNTCRSADAAGFACVFLDSAIPHNTNQVQNNLGSAPFVLPAQKIAVYDVGGTAVKSNNLLTDTPAFAGAVVAGVRFTSSKDFDLAAGVPLFEASAVPVFVLADFFALPRPQRCGD